MWAVTREKIDTLHLMPGEINTPRDNLLKAFLRVYTTKEKRNEKSSLNGPQNAIPDLQPCRSVQKQARRLGESWALHPTSQTSDDFKDRLARF